MNYKIFITLWDLLIANGLLGLAGGMAIPSIMALGVIEGRRSEAMAGTLVFWKFSGGKRG